MWIASPSAPSAASLSISEMVGWGWTSHPSSVVVPSSNLVMATSPSVAFRFGERTQDPVQMYLSDVLTLPANIAGIPGISVPSGLVDGMPVGFQILAAPLHEETMLRVAYAYEQATDWHKLRPEL